MTIRRFGHVPLHAPDTVQYLQTPLPTEAFAPLPAPTGPAPYRMELATLLPAEPSPLTFTVIGDSGGIVDPAPQQAVAAALAKAPGSFVYHVGDLVYFNGEDGQWFQQMYEPYDPVAVPFVGIPGNHDGWALPGSTSLQAFVANMCAPAPVLTADAKDAHRDAMTQPNVFWTLRAAAVTVIGLYTNVPSGGAVKPDQAAWLAGELRDAPADRPVIVALHHPPFSADAHHGGSQAMGSVIDAAVLAAERWPDLVISGHVHDYQRFTRTVIQGDPTTGTKKQIPYLVVGASGYHNLHGMSPGIGPLPWQATGDTVLNAYVDKLYGFLTLTVSDGKISGSYTTVAKDGTVTANADTF